LIASWHCQERTLLSQRAATGFKLLQSSGGWLFSAQALQFMRCRHSIMSDLLETVYELEIRVPDADAVTKYLSDFPSLESNVSEILELAKREFPDCDLSLEMTATRDMKGRYLALMVRQNPYDPELGDKLDIFSSNYCSNFSGDGDFKVETDFM
jgi:hypothetical protein